MTLNVHLDVGIKLYTAEQVRLIEQNYAQTDPNGTYPLMERAGQAAFNLVKKHWPKAHNIVILIGKGNNGGDGFVLARLAAEHRYKVTLCLLCDESAIKGDAKIAFNKLPKIGIKTKSWQSLNFSNYDLIIDALLGSGIKGALREPFDQVVGLVNDAKTPVLAIDIPSGLEANSGTAFGLAIKADLTVTFIGLKRGLYTGDAAEYRGEVTLASLNVQKDHYQKANSSVTAQNWRSLKHLLKPRSFTAHKGNYGHCVLVGGSKGMTGAMVLAAKASLRAGSGLTSVVVEQGADSLVASQPEIMAQNVKFPTKSFFDQFPKLNSLVVGPGLGQDERGNQWMQFISESTNGGNKIFGNKVFGNKVFDADALNWLALNPNKDSNRVLTPHPGEAARLLGCSISQINQDRFSACEQITQKYGGVCVLKGAGTIVGDEQGNIMVCPVGNPGMATGGMGDVLSGLIGGLMAQGFSLFNAAALAVCIHGEAADRAAGKSLLYRGMAASDLFEYFPALLNPINQAKTF